jgi:methylphosphotriester-DNA--protein-cysteine methyltransferase
MFDDDARYRAVHSRDARFDGVFYIAVTTTGIYCRPSCPATTPKRANVRFMRTAAEAQAAGFRACRRCRRQMSEVRWQMSDGIGPTRPIAPASVIPRLTAVLEPRMRFAPTGATRPGV